MMDLRQPPLVLDVSGACIPASRRFAGLCLAAGLIAAIYCSSAVSEPEGVASSKASPAAWTGAPTFTRDVLPLLQSRCQVCHRPGQIGPMSLLTYAEVRPWAKSILKSVSNRLMPPFAAAAPLNYFRDDPRLTDVEIETIVQWVKSGSPRGNPADAPAPVDWSSREWLIEEPDLVVKFAKYQVKTNSTDDYVLFCSEYVFPVNTWVRAIELRSSDYKLVHHASVWAADSSFVFLGQPVVENFNVGVNARKGVLGLLSQHHLITWLPGQGPRTRPEGEAFQIPKGTKLVVESHISPTIDPATVQLGVALKFINGIVDKKANTLLWRFNDIEIEPGDPSYVRTATRTFGMDVVVRGYSVHMHLRGKSSKFLFHYPDGRIETAFEVPKWDFNWQREYYLSTPLQVPKGTVVEFVAEWDNSTGNPANPDPTQSVQYGGKTLDEMYGGKVLFAVDRNIPLLIESGRFKSSIPPGALAKTSSRPPSAPR